MSLPVPKCLSRFCKSVLPVVHRATHGKRILESVRAVQGTDRWNSFDRFHETTERLVREYESAGAVAEVTSIATGGRIGTGRWIIHEAEDVRRATVDIIHPVKQRILDYAKNPWHLIQWGTSTAPAGIETELAILDKKEELEKLSPGALAGKTVLTCLDPRGQMKLLAEKGAATVITDRPIKNHPQACAWSKFGWGGININDAAIHLVGMVLSQRDGKKLRRLNQKHGRLKMLIKVDVRKYVGTHDVVSGIIRGEADPQDEVWAIAHSAEPGAIDNASGVATTLEIARVIEKLIAEGRLPRPRRSIRLLNAYECYGFFGYLEHAHHFQNPLAGVCIDTVGSRPEICDGILGWHASIPMSAGFVNRVGDAILSATLKIHNPGYHKRLRPFVSTSDTLIGDPKFGFPCPWLTTHFKKDGKTTWDAYHSSADLPNLLSAPGLATCAASMAGYLYFLADATTEHVTALATAETRRTLQEFEKRRRKLSPDDAHYLNGEHRTNIEQLKRWLWGGKHTEVISALEDCRRQVESTGATLAKKKWKRSTRVPEAARRIPYRRAFLSPTMENTPKPIADRIGKTKLSPWALFWADGRRSLAEITRAISCEKGEDVAFTQVIEFFDAHHDLGYVDFVEKEDLVTRKRLIADLKKLGVQLGMDLMVHSSLSKIGFVEGGPDTVIDALLAVIGKRGTLVMPSFNHRRATVFNPLATPTTNGAVPDAFWRRPDATRSLHPTHAVAALGPRAEEICRDHLEKGVWAADSPIGRFIHSGGFILALGVNHTASTAYHVAEVSMPAGCIDPFGSRDKVLLPDGTVQEVKGLAFRSGVCPVPITKLDETLDRRKLQRRGKVGEADAALVRAIDLWNVRRQHLKSACPRCTIQPQRVHNSLTSE